MIQQSRTRRRYDFDLLLEQFNRRITGWVLGTGLLAFHAGVFFLMMTGLIFWNVYDNPKDFWTGDLLKRWGAVLILHAVVTVAGTVGWRLLRSADIQEARQEQWAAIPRHAPVVDGSWRALESGTPVEPQPYIPPSEPDLPKLSAAQRFRMNAARRVAAMRGKADEVSPTAAASWPEPPARRDPEADDLIRQFGTGESETRDAEFSKERRPGQTRWSWVEAAATNWLTKKETPETPPERQPRVAPPSPPPSTPPEDDEPFAL
jgi:hypothetical protein